LGDSHPVVREHAVRISETILAALPEGKAGVPTTKRLPLDALASALLRLVDDPSIRVRYQLAFTLGQWADSRAASTLVKLPARDVGNEEMQLAVMSSAPGHLEEMFNAALASGDQSAPLLPKLFELAAAQKDEHSLERALAAIGKTGGSGGYVSWQFEALGGIL